MKINKKLLYWLTAVLIVGWVAFRFAAIGSENERYVFNASRVAADVGAPVEVLRVMRSTDVLREPLHVQNNRAYVSGARVGKFQVGQKVGNGKIISVGSRLDLDTGMYVIKTAGVADGLNYAESKSAGYFVPVYAINNDVVMVEIDGVAHRRDVKIAARDSEYALITSGLNDGENVILSTIHDGDRVKY